MLHILKPPISLRTCLWMAPNEKFDLLSYMAMFIVAKLEKYEGELFIFRKKKGALPVNSKIYENFFVVAFTHYCPLNSSVS